MERKLWLTVFVFCFIMLLPNAVSATEVDGVNPNQEASADYGRVVTEE